MKKLLYLLCFLAFGSFAQNTTTKPSGAPPFTPQWWYSPVSPDSLNKFGFVNPVTGKVNWMISYTQFNATVGRATLAAIAAGGGKLASTITILQAQPTVGTVLNAGSSLDSVIKAMFAPPQLPSITTFGYSVTYPLTSASTQSQTLSYAYTKVTGTSNIASATLNGSTSGITQNINAASGTVGVTFFTNTTTNYTFRVTTIDPIYREAYVQINYLPHLLYGRAAGTVATGTELTAHAGGSNPLTSSHAGPWTVTASGTNRVFIAYPASEGPITSFTTTNGTDISTLFNLTTLSYTSFEGYTQTYNIYTFANATGADFTFITN